MGQVGSRAWVSGRWVCGGWACADQRWVYEEERRVCGG